MTFGDSLRQFQSDMNDLADNLEATARGLAVAVCDRAAELAMAEWPVDTGYSAGRWVGIETSVGGAVVNDAYYASYVYAAGDEERTPIYPQVLSMALSEASRELDFTGTFEDLTAPYVGQGRTTAHLTGVSRKFLIHAPPNERRAWQEQCPQLIESITVEWRGMTREMQVVPSDVVAGGAMGSGRL